MKATELMIGDWVLYGGEPNIITEVSEIIHGEATVCFVGNNYMANIDEIKPIPLTKETLEKNFSENVILWRSVDYPTKSFVIEYIEEGTDANDIIITIEYVHELQHVLRLCGIDKEIEL